MSRPKIKPKTNSPHAPVSLPVLEARFNAYVKESANAIGQIGQNQADIDVALDAVVQILGKEVVEAKILEIQTKKAKESYELMYTKIEEALASNDLSKQEGVETEQDFVEFSQTDVNGNIIEPGNVIVHFTGLKEDFQAVVKAMKVGETKEIEGRGTFTLVAVYGAPKATEQLN